MTEIRFYHLTTSPLERALPALAARASEGGKRVVIACKDKKRAEDLNQLLWTYDPNSFLPHGSADSAAEFAQKQPIWLTQTESDNPNQAEILIMTENTVWSDLSSFTLCCEMLNGHDPDAIQSARSRWKTYKEQGHNLTYWQQNDQGAWEKKA